jgi:hypothetical protein
MLSVLRLSVIMMIAVWVNVVAPFLMQQKEEKKLSL